MSLSCLNLSGLESVLFGCVKLFSKLNNCTFHRHHSASLCRLNKSVFWRTDKAYFKEEGENSNLSE